MRIAALAGMALLTTLLTRGARADPLPSWPIPPPGWVPALPPAPANELGRFLQAVQSCPPVEIAPGIFVPIPCAAALPKPPPDAPTLDLPLPAIVPVGVDLRAQGLDGPTKDQKQTGVCFAFAITSVLENSLRRQGRADVLSPLHFVAEDGWSDLWRDSPREAIALESSWPYDPVKACRFLDRHDSCEQSYGVQAGSWHADPVLAAERDRAARAGVAWTGRARVLKNRPIEQIVSSLASGREVFAQIDIDSAAWSWRGAKGGVLPEYERADRGGHAIALVGYRTVGASRQFLVHNSWGRQWGDGGYVWMSEASLRAHLRDAEVVEARVASGPIAPPAPAQVPVPAVSAPACAAGTAIDVATGRCAATCQSGLAPFMGRCWLG